MFCLFMDAFIYSVISVFNTLCISSFLYLCSHYYFIYLVRSVSYVFCLTFLIYVCLYFFSSLFHYFFMYFFPYVCMLRYFVSGVFRHLFL